MNAFACLKDRRVFVTGHTGFKGSWLAIWLHKLGAEVYGYALPPPTEPSNYALAAVNRLLHGETLGDIRNRNLMSTTLRTFHPDVVFHLAAQPLVRDSYNLPFETFEANVMGTASVLEAVREMRRPCAVVCITTDKCYENREQFQGYRETDPMGGFDPYSASKGAAEILIASYRRAFFNPSEVNRHGVQIATARAGNVIGGGDWARDRVVPDMVSALLAGRAIPIRNPSAVRPWQHVLEPLAGYLTIAKAMIEKPDAGWCEGWNFGPVEGAECTVGRLADLFVKAWGTGDWIDQSSPNHPHEATTLRLNIEKAGMKLGWQPRWDSEEMVNRTAHWYRRILCDGADACNLCMADIEAYEGHLL